MSSGGFDVVREIIGNDAVSIFISSNPMIVSSLLELTLRMLPLLLDM
jgi:hypothetical protein